MSSDFGSEDLGTFFQEKTFLDHLRETQIIKEMFELIEL